MDTRMDLRADTPNSAPHEKARICKNHCSPLPLHLRVTDRW